MMNEEQKKEVEELYEDVTKEEGGFWMTNEEIKDLVKKTDDSFSDMAECLKNETSPRNFQESVDEINKKWQALHKAMHDVMCALDASIWYIEKYGDDKHRVAQERQIKKDKNPRIITKTLRNMKIKPKEHTCSVCKCGEKNGKD